VHDSGRPCSQTRDAGSNMALAPHCGVALVRTQRLLCKQRHRLACFSHVALLIPLASSTTFHSCNVHSRLRGVECTLGHGTLLHIHTLICVLSNTYGGMSHHCTGILNMKSCCPKSCGVCGGPDCGAHPCTGELPCYQQCCEGSTAIKNRSCDAFGPPCHLGPGAHPPPPPGALQSTRHCFCKVLFVLPLKSD
jgi:hypothetical protein